VSRTYAAQKGALTRALKKGRDAVVVECRKVVKEWGDVWPDDWSRWQRALDDVAFGQYRLEDL
jgi:hypothetical protein